MRNYLVLVESEDFINVDAETEEEAIQEARKIAEGSFATWKCTVMSSNEV